MKQFSKELGKVSITPKGAWNINITSERLDIVYDKRNNQAYIAKQNVPVGVDIDNREYWQPMNVTGYADNNFINLTTENENGTITAYESLEEAVATILPINRRVGATLSFYNLNSDRLDRQAEFELWQFNSTDLANWENKNYWNNIYYNWNVFAGWYVGVDSLENHVKIPNVGQYAYVGTNLNDALLYQCRTNGTWTNTGIKVRNYISVIVSGNITIGENGNWFSNGEDTGIPATPAVDEQLDDIIIRLQQHNAEISNLKKFDANLQDQIISNDSDITRLTAKHESLSKTVQGIAASGGASIATNVTYNNDVSGLNAENAQDAIDELQNSKFDKVNVAQESGEAEDKVMSQKAVSDKLSDLDIIKNETIKNLSKCEYGCATSLYESLQYIEKDDIFVQLVSNKQYPRKITKLTYKGADSGTLKIYKVKIVDDIAQTPILVKVVSEQTASIKETELDILLSKDEYIGVSGDFSYSNNADREYSTMVLSSTGGEVGKTSGQYLGYTLYGESYSSRIDEIENATEENNLKTEQNTKDISALYKKVNEIIYSDKIYERKDFVDGMYYAAESRYRTDGNYGKVIHTPNMEIQGVILTIPKDKVDSYGFSVNFWDSNGDYIGNWFTNHTFAELSKNGFTKENSILFSLASISEAISQKKYNNVQYFTIEVFEYTDTYYEIPQDADIIVSKYDSSSNFISENVIVVDAFGGGDYTSLQEAIDTRKDMGSNGKPLVILLMPGTYHMSQTTSENRGYCNYRTISIIGLNKDSCIIRNDDGIYNTGASGTYIDSAPLKMAGNCFLENLTIISTATNSTSEASENKSYCVHLDFFANEGTRLTVHNCRMINDHNCCIGIGLHKDYTIEISNCELESTNTNGNGWGTIIAHEGSEKGDCKLILKDNVIVDHTNNGITITHPYNGSIVLDLVRNVVVNNGSPITMDNKYHTLSNMCFGNNRNEMNKQT